MKNKELTNNIKDGANVAMQIKNLLYLFYKHDLWLHNIRKKAKNKVWRYASYNGRYGCYKTRSMIV